MDKSASERGKRGKRGESEKSVEKEAGRQERGKEEGIQARKAREEYKQGGRMEKEDAEEKDKGRRGSIHSNSVVKATACPTARRYLWDGFWVASVAANVTANRVPPPPRCPLFLLVLLLLSA